MRHRIRNELIPGRVLGVAIASSVLFLAGCTIQEAGHPVAPGTAAEPQDDKARFDRLLNRGFDFASCLINSNNSLVEPGPDALTNTNAIWGPDDKLNTGDDGQQNVFMVAERPIHTSGPPILYMHLALKATLNSDLEESLTVQVAMQPNGNFAKSRNVPADSLRKGEIDHGQPAYVAFVAEPGQGLMLLRNGDQVSFREPPTEPSNTLHPLDGGQLDTFEHGLNQNIISLTEAAGARC